MPDQDLHQNGNKIAVLIHGYPEPIYKDTPIYKYFAHKGYTIIEPYLFNPTFKLDQKTVLDYIKGELKGKKPDVIVGVSMGGLIAPYLAKEFPASKLVLVATGPYLRTNVWILNQLITISKKPLFQKLFNIMENTPEWLYRLVYVAVNRPKIPIEEKIKLQEHISKNWSSLVAIPLEEDREVAEFLIGVDNTPLLKFLKNKTIIFSALEDVMMPVVLSKQLHSLIKGSTLVISPNRIHNFVFTEDNFKDLDRFLR